MDVRAPDRPAEVQRLCALGATEAGAQPVEGLTVMQDPEGNEFCVIDA